ncbi:MAG: hypothetical protein HC908_17490 [Calothrix sp. SM1_7_51]|nr:hypothetical protein [Calothrix sp. SM1_7_51]
MHYTLSKPKTFGNKRNNKGSSPREQGGKQHWVKSDAAATKRYAPLRECFDAHPTRDKFTHLGCS